MTEESTVLTVSRRIAAPASRLFELLADPQRHAEFDGSDMVRAAPGASAVGGVGDTFTVQMHRLGRDYSMINYVTEFEPDRRIFWQPAPGDVDTAGGDPAKIGVPSGYRWGYILTPDGDDATVVTEIFDSGSDDNRWILEREGGKWINGSTTVHDTMRVTLEKIDEVMRST